MVRVPVSWGRVFRPGRMDLLTAAGLFALGGTLFAAGWYPFFHDAQTLAPWDVPTAVRFVPLAGACAAVLVRRAAPVTALGVGLLFGAVDLLMGFSIPMLLVLSELLYSATLYGSRRVSRVLVRVVVVLVAGGSALFFSVIRDWRLVLLLTMLLVLILLTPVGWAVTVRHEREVAEAERTRARQVARIAELDRVAAVAEERARMARDLHDVIAGHLSAIAIQSGALLTVADGDPATVNRVLRAIRENSIKGLNEMRTMVELLRGNSGEERGSLRDAPARIANLQPLLASARASGLSATMTVKTGSGEEGTGEYHARELPVATDLVAYRIVQEALTNAVKHASGASARVLLRRVDDDLHVEVTNDLVDTASPLRSGGVGLINMRERAAAVGGTLTAGRAGNTWRVHAVLPIGRGGWVSRS